MSGIHKMDKVNMSLDDIIKSNRKGARQGQFNKNRNGLGGSNPNNNNANARNKQNQRNNNNNNSKRKPFGMLNKSKTIRKNKKNQQFNNNNNKNKNSNLAIAADRLNFNTQQQQQQQPQQQKQLFRTKGSIARRRFPNRSRGTLPRRFGPKRFSNQQQQQQQQQQPQKITAFNGNNSASGKSIQARLQLKQQRQQRPRPQRRQLTGRRNPFSVAKATNTTSLNIRNRIALQTARKNVQKAKRLLAARKSTVKKIMGQTSVKGGGGLAGGARSQTIPTQQRQRKGLAIRPRSTKQLSSRNNPKMVRINVSNKLKQPKPQVKRFTKPILKRNRGGVQSSRIGTGSNRMVFY